MKIVSTIILFFCLLSNVHAVSAKDLNAKIEILAKKRSQFPDCDKKLQALIELLKEYAKPGNALKTFFAGYIDILAKDYKECEERNKKLLKKGPEVTDVNISGNLGFEF